MIMTPRHSRFSFFSLKIILGVVFCFMIFAVNQAQAGCFAGVPCIVPKTPNLPLLRGDGPTAPGAPNQPKATGGGVCIPTNNPAPGCTCDADFMNQIYARAWMESQRDMIKAQVLIRKPDSILEYTCFNQFNDLAVERAAPLFSETERWTGTGSTPPSLGLNPAELFGDAYNILPDDLQAFADAGSGEIDVSALLTELLQKFMTPQGFIGLTGPGFLGGMLCMPHHVPITSNWLIGWINWFPVPCVGINVYMGPDRLATSLEGLVRASLRNYIDQNFSHRFLGGAATSLDYIEISGAGGYNCNFMDQVYFLSKCTDIITDDRFWKFSELIDIDPRVLPEMCTGGTKFTQEMIDLAENRDYEYVIFDRVFSNNWLLAHEGGQTGCTPPIPTGLITVLKTYDVDSRGNVSVTSTEEILDKFCVAPNCHYEGGATCVAP